MKKLFCTKHQSKCLNYSGEMKNDGLINDNSRIVFVDDGSKDKTWSIIDELTKAHTEISGIKLAKNAGHQNRTFRRSYDS